MQEDGVGCRWVGETNRSARRKNYTLRLCGVVATSEAQPVCTDHGSKKSMIKTQLDIQQLFESNSLSWLEQNTQLSDT